MKLRLTRASLYLFSGFLAVIALIGYIWYPLLRDYLALYDPAYPWWIQIDWLLIGNFLAMSALIIFNADLRRDLPVVLVGFAGGLAIEGWGTQTYLWTYYTLERPPLWIIPAWPVASLAIDRLYRTLNHLTRPLSERFFRAAYWLIFPTFYALMLVFVHHTLDKSLTLLSLLLCALLILSPREARAMTLIFIAGSALGYFLELWGTTRECWTYYTRETPPFFAILAHGMASVAFYRSLGLARLVIARLKTFHLKIRHVPGRKAYED